MASTTRPTAMCCCFGDGAAPVRWTPPVTSCAAIADQRVIKGMAAQMSLRREHLASGARHLGWKVGFTTKAAMERMGTSAPLFGFMTDRSLVKPGSTLSIAGWTRGVLEPEVAVHLRAGSAAGAGEAEGRAAIAGLGPAVELADLDPDVQDVE